MFESLWGEIPPPRNNKLGLRKDSPLSAGLLRREKKKKKKQVINIIRLIFFLVIS